MDELKRLIIPCAAEDDMISFTAFGIKSYQDEPPTTHLSFFTHTFYSKQISLLRKVRERMKLLLAIALGREYILEDLMLIDAEAHQQIADFFQQQAEQILEWERANGRSAE